MIHGALPERILFFRDGVGEGQMHYVYQHEIEHLRKTLSKHYETAEKELKLAVIIVNKKINTRIFKAQGNMNPISGTVVDDVITLPERYDFFLISQNVRQGTVAPTSYNVVHDTFGLAPGTIELMPFLILVLFIDLFIPLLDKMQILTYKMCHMYYNWSGTVRVPAVCLYAHKLAFLVGQHIHQIPNSTLANRLFFL